MGRYVCERLINGKRGEQCKDLRSVQYPMYGARSSPSPSRDLFAGLLGIVATVDVPDRLTVAGLLNGGYGLDVHGRPFTGSPVVLGRASLEFDSVHGRTLALER